MKKLYLYLLKEFFSSFFLGVALFTFMLIIFQAMELMDLIITKGVPKEDVLLLFIYILPSFLAITIPMAVLTGILMTYGKLAQNNEIIALKSAGISLLKIANPIILVSFLLSCLMVLFNDKILPWGNNNFRDLYFKIVYEKTQVAMKEKIFITDFPGYIIYIENLTPKTSLFKDIKIIRFKNNKPENAIFAKSGTLLSDKENMKVSFRLYQGTIHQLSEKFNKRYYKINFLHHSINLDLSNTLSNKISRSTGDMSIDELNKEIEKALPPEKNIFRVELHKKISIPFACLAFTLIGIPLGVMIKKSGKSVGFGISLILIIIYYAILITGVALGESNKVTPWLAIWFPNFIISISGIFLLFLAVNDAGIFERK
ncbi:MAG: LptF/LptG family permease [Candidatus Firestonebacteria bacterium]|nr:LptF/LptG family permease [Candidatus Firestonebacteria bacterium]